MENRIVEKDRDELRASGLSDDWIKDMEARTISANQAKELGFCFIHNFKGQKLDLINEGYLESCLYYPFFDQFGKQVYDEQTKKAIGVIKPRFKIDVVSNLGLNKLPKYLCLPKDIQTRQYIHYPKGFNWSEFYSRDTDKDLYLTEGLKKSESLCSQGEACICIWSVFCFNESGMESPLIPELKALLKDTTIKPIIVFDSDKTIKQGVEQAEIMLVDKIASEVRKQAFILDLPQVFNDKETKGLDDFLVVAGIDNFRKLHPKSIYTPFLSFSKLTQVPSIPREYTPRIYQEVIDHIDENFEGCLEIVPLALFSQGAIALGNTYELAGKKANFYGIGIAETTSGKSSIAREVLKPIFNINRELHDTYNKAVKDSRENQSCSSEIRTEHFIISSFTEEGLSHFLSNVAKRPIAMFFETEEFDNFLSKFSRDYGSSLSSFVTKVYDAKFISPNYSYERQQKQGLLNTIYDPAITIGGIGTGIGIMSAMPKNYNGTGFDNRFQKFIGKHRFGKCIYHPKPLPKDLESKLERILRLIIGANINQDLPFKFSLGVEAEELYKIKYREFKTWEDKNQSNSLVPYFRRSLSDASFKLALQFEIVNKAHEIVCSLPEDKRQVEFDRWLITGSNLISLESMYNALEWTKYFFLSSKYFNEKYQGDTNLDSKLEQSIEVLKNNPKGLLCNQLRRKINLHRTANQKSEFNEIVEILVDNYEAELINGKRQGSMIIKLKKHLSQDHG
jgi:hypothetical protein